MQKYILQENVEYLHFCPKSCQRMVLQNTVMYSVDSKMYGKVFPSQSTVSFAKEELNL